MHVAPKQNFPIKHHSMIDSTNALSFNDFQRKASQLDERSLTNFSTKDEYVEAMVEDLCDWLNFLYNLTGDDEMVPSRFFHQLSDGVILNKHAKVVQTLAEQFLLSKLINDQKLPLKIGNQIMKVPNTCPTYVIVDFSKTMNSFHKRDNVANFIHWCRDFNIPPSLTFETEDLIASKNPRSVVVCLLEIARIGRLFGMEVPDIIQLEEEIDREIDDCNTSVGIEIDSDKPLVMELSQEVDEKEEFENNEEIKNTEEKTEALYKNITFRKKIPKPQAFRDCRYEHMNGFQDTAVTQYEKIVTIDTSENKVENHQSLNLYDYTDCYNYSSDKSDQKLSRIDNSDNESLNSHGSVYTIPKYKTARPIGRVKIYDCFDQSNFVREKKYREKCDLRSLDERVRDILSECQCSETFPMKRISEGKYQWGDKKTHIFVRILRNHVMVRVGGGWDTLNEFLRKHDHCRKDKNGSRSVAPQIRGKFMKTSATCPSDLSDISPDVTVTCDEKYSNNLLNVNKFTYTRRHSLLPNLNKTSNTNTNGTNNCISHRMNDQRVQSALDFSSKQSSSDPKLSENDDSSGNFDNKENSSKLEMNGSSPEIRLSVQTNQPTTISDNDSVDITQPRPIIHKYISRIPIFKKK